ncbi:hypothetical protein S245_012644, partial [Arachis hypogaea]
SLLLELSNSPPSLPLQKKNKNHITCSVQPSPRHCRSPPPSHMLEAAVSIALVSATARSRRPYRVVPPSRNRCSAVSALFHRATALLSSSSATLHPPLLQFHCAPHPPLLQFRDAPPSAAPVPRRCRPGSPVPRQCRPLLLQFCRVQPSVLLNLCTLEVHL